MSCNIRIPIQQIIDDVAAALAGNYISVDNPFLNEAVLTDTTLRGDVTADTAARNALCAILQSCGVTAEELEWLDRPTAAGQVAISADTGSGMSAAWTSLSQILEDNNDTIKDALEEYADTSVENAIQGLLVEGGRITDRFVKVEPRPEGVVRDQHEKNLDSFSIRDFGFLADGVTNENEKIVAVEAAYTGVPIDMHGGTIVADIVPSNNYFYNGSFDLGGVVRPARYVGEIHADDNLIAIGKNAGAAHTGTQGVRNCIAIGQDAMKSNTKGRHNIALGVSALHYLNGTDRGGILGTRNIAIGGNAGRFMTSGYGNIIMGRDSGHSLADVETLGVNKVPLLNVIIGTNAVMGDSPNVLQQGEIENHTPSTAARNVVLGTQAGFYLNEDDSVIIGYRSGYHSKKSYGNTSIGAFSFENHEADRSPFGNNLTTTDLPAIYSQSGTNTVRVTTVSNHGVVSGGKVQIRFTSGPLGDDSYNDTMWLHNVVVISPTVIEVQSPVVKNATGEAKIFAIDNLVEYTKSSGECVGVGYKVGNGVTNFRSVGVGFAAGARGLGVENTAIGYGVMTKVIPGANSTAVGAYSQESATGAANVSIGVLSLPKVSGNDNIAMGNKSAYVLTSGAQNISIGSSTLLAATTAKRNVTIGHGSTSANIAGMDNVAIGNTALASSVDSSNSVVVGANAANKLNTGNDNVVLGAYAMTASVGVSKCVAVGSGALRFDTSGAISEFSESVGIGFGARVSAAKQIQLGETGVTTYAFGAVQDRSDARDKIVEGDITNAHIDFFNAVEFKRYRLDYRDDYISHDEDGNIILSEKDGSKAGKREHVGVIAQQVEAAMISAGVDFAGLQHHQKNGGNDVYTVGYQEFIPIMGEILQRQQKQIDTLMKLLIQEDK